MGERECVCVRKGENKYLSGRVREWAREIERDRESGRVSERYIEK